MKALPHKQTSCVYVVQNKSEQNSAAAAAAPPQYPDNRVQTAGSSCTKYLTEVPEVESFSFTLFYNEIRKQLVFFVFL